MEAGSDRYPKLDSQGAIFGASGYLRHPPSAIFYSVLLQLHKTHGLTIFHLSVYFISINIELIDIVLD